MTPIDKSITPILTIDGPSGVGKGSVAKAVAEEKGWNLLDSGAIYRAFALCVERNKIHMSNEPALQNLAINFNLQFSPKKDQELLAVYLDGLEVSTELRSEKTGELASKLASIGLVRQALLERQRAFASPPGLVADGRDMGTVVFPRAAFKVFLTASTEERAKRRLKQLRAIGVQGIMTQILAEVTKRDERDMTRQHSPLIPAEDAHIIDTTNLSINEVITKVMTFIKT